MSASYSASCSALSSAFVSWSSRIGDPISARARVSVVEVPSLRSVGAQARRCPGRGARARSGSRARAGAAPQPDRLVRPGGVRGRSPRHRRRPAGARDLRVSRRTRPTTSAGGSRRSRVTSRPSTPGGRARTPRRTLRFDFASFAGLPDAVRCARHLERAAAEPDRPLRGRRGRRDRRRHPGPARDVPVDRRRSTSCTSTPRWRVARCADAARPAHCPARPRSCTCRAKPRACAPVAARVPPGARSPPRSRCTSSSTRSTTARRRARTSAPTPVVTTATTPTTSSRPPRPRRRGSRPRCSTPAATTTTAPADPPMCATRRSWCTSTGPRVRLDVAVATPGGRVTSDVPGHRVPRRVLARRGTQARRSSSGCRPTLATRSRVGRARAAASAVPCSLTLGSDTPSPRGSAARRHAGPRGRARRGRPVHRALHAVGRQRTAAHVHRPSEGGGAVRPLGGRVPWSRTRVLDRRRAGHYGARGVRVVTQAAFRARIAVGSIARMRVRIGAAVAVGLLLIVGTPGIADAAPTPSAVVRPGRVADRSARRGGVVPGARDLRDRKRRARQLHHARHAHRARPRHGRFVVAVAGPDPHTPLRPRELPRLRLDVREPRHLEHPVAGHHGRVRGARDPGRAHQGA